jgi:hypothetical protein
MNLSLKWQIFHVRYSLNEKKILHLVIWPQSLWQSGFFCLHSYPLQETRLDRSAGWFDKKGANCSNLFVSIILCERLVILVFQKPRNQIDHYVHGSNLKIEMHWWWDRHNTNLCEVIGINMAVSSQITERTNSSVPNVLSGYNVSHLIFGHTSRDEFGI